MFLLHPALNFFLNEHQIFTGFFSPLHASAASKSGPEKAGGCLGEKEGRRPQCCYVYSNAN